MLYGIQVVALVFRLSYTCIYCTGIIIISNMNNSKWIVLQTNNVILLIILSQSGLVFLFRNLSYFVLYKNLPSYSLVLEW